MTGTTDGVRSLFLAALIVGSVVGATVAFSGSAAAIGNTEPEITSVSEDGGAIEIAFNTAVEKNETTAGGGYTPAFADDTPLDAEAIEVYVRRAGSVDYDVYTDAAVRGTREGGTLTVSPQGRTGTSGTGDAQYVIDIPALGDLDPADDVKINFTQPVDNADEEPPGVYAAAINNVTVPTSSTVIREAGPGSADTAHNTRASAAQVYRGEPINVEANAAGTRVFVRNVGTNEVVLDGGTGTNSRYLPLGSGDLRSGATYKITYGGSSGPGKFFNVSTLDLEADLGQDGTGFAFDDPVRLDVSASAVRGNAPILVNTGVRPFVAYRERLDGRTEFESRYNEGTNRSGLVRAGSYSVTVTDVETGVTAVAGGFSVRGFPEADAARFPEGVVTEDRGDVVEIPISLRDSEDGARATLSIGSLGDTNYVTNLTVVDENGDGEVTVEWNTFNAGVNDLHRVFNATGPDTIETWEWERGAFVDALQNGANYDGANPNNGRKNYTTAKNLTVDATNYELQVVANGGDQPDAVSNFTGVDADDAAQIVLDPDGVDDSRVWVSPGANAGEVDREWIHDNLDDNADGVDGNLTDSAVVTDGEVIVQQVEARGVEGVVENRSAFAGADTVSEQFAFLNETAQHLAYLGRIYGSTKDTRHTPMWDIRYNETVAEFNRDPRGINVNATTVDFIPDYDNDTYFIVVDTDNVESEKLTDGLTWWANVSLAGQSSLSGRSEGDGGDTSDVWEYREPDATLQTDTDDTVVVRAAEDQVLRGETNVAPGTRLEIRTASESEASPFLETPTARVSARRTFSAAVDFFADVGGGTNFTAVVRRGGDGISDEYDGRVTGIPRASVSLSDQAVGETDQVVVVDQVTVSDSGFVALHWGHAAGPIVGSSGYLTAGSHSDVRVALDEDLADDATLVAMAHVDDNPNNRFDFPGADAPYSVNGTVVTDSASIQIGEDTPTPAATPTPTPVSTQTPTATPTPIPVSTPTPTPTPLPTLPPPTTVTTSDGGPGFGTGVAVVAMAVAVAALLMARRRE